MKFLELPNGDFVQINEILHIYHKVHEKKYYSCLKLKNGLVVDFLETPDEFFDSNDNSILLDYDHISSLNRHALFFILNTSNNLISSDEVSDYAWQKFADEYEKLYEKQIYKYDPNRPT